MKTKEVDLAIQTIKEWRNDWVKFAVDVFGITLDKEQQDILYSVQHNRRTSVASGTARGKDFIAAVASKCFLILTPMWNSKGELIQNTKVALTAPTARQVKNIMMPEISRLYNRAIARGLGLNNWKLTSSDIRTGNAEWFLTGFKADEHNHEAWSGFHAANTMFVVTEATGVSDNVFNAIEGNLQGNSRILLVFNPNISTGYAAKSQRGDRWHKFRLNSLNAPNVVEKKIVIPGQVDYEWVEDKLHNWCEKITKENAKEENDDFEFEGQWYSPNDLFRVKVLGKPPKVAEGALIPEQWIRLAQERYLKTSEEEKQNIIKQNALILGADIAGMGRDSTCLVYRYARLANKINKHSSGGKVEHMKTAGLIYNELKINANNVACIDTIGEGAGTYARVVELGKEKQVISSKFSHRAVDKHGRALKDLTEQYEFVNMRAFCFWAVRDWLDPANGANAMLPPSETLIEETNEIRWFFRSDGKIQIEKKEDIKKRLGRSTDEFDALALTFYPIPNNKPQNLRKYF